MLYVWKDQTGSKFIMLINRVALEKTYLVLKQVSDCKHSDLQLWDWLWEYRAVLFLFKIIIPSYIQGSDTDSVIQCSKERLPRLPGASGGRLLPRLIVIIQSLVWIEVKMLECCFFNFVSGMNYIFIYSKTLWSRYLKSVLPFYFK